MKTPIRQDAGELFNADGTLVEVEDVREIVRRANAFDELLDFLRRYVSVGSQADRALYLRLTKD